MKAPSPQCFAFLTIMIGNNIASHSPSLQMTEIARHLLKMCIRFVPYLLSFDSLFFCLSSLPYVCVYQVDRDGDNRGDNMSTSPVDPILPELVWFHSDCIISFIFFASKMTIPFFNDAQSNRPSHVNDNKGNGVDPVFDTDSKTPFMDHDMVIATLVMSDVVILHTS